MDAAARGELLGRYWQDLDFNDDNTAWFDKVRALCRDLGYAVKPKDYKKNPDQYRGSIVEVSNTIRIAVTGRANSPDLWRASQLLGPQRVEARLKKFM